MRISWQRSDKVSKALKDLSQHQKKLAPFDMRKAFAGKGDRFAEFSAAQDDLLLDFSKCAVTSKTMKLLLALAKAADVAKKRDAMFAGEIINTTEGRAVLHTALRNQSKSPVMVAGRDVMPDVRGVLAAMAKFSDERAGERDHRCGEYRHWRLGPRPRHDHAGAGALP